MKSEQQLLRGIETRNKNLPPAKPWQRRLGRTLIVAGVGATVLIVAYVVWVANTYTF